MNKPTSFSYPLIVWFPFIPSTWQQLLVLLALMIGVITYWPAYDSQAYSKEKTGEGIGLLEGQCLPKASLSLTLRTSIKHSSIILFLHVSALYWYKVLSENVDL